MNDYKTALASSWHAEEEIKRRGLHEQYIERLLDKIGAPAIVDRDGDVNRDALFQLAHADPKTRLIVAASLLTTNA